MKSNENIFFGNQDEYSILVTSKYCYPCKEAKKIINKLIEEGYLVKIEDLEDHPEVKSVPTLIYKGKHYSGLLTEDEYRAIIPKRPDDKRRDYDLI